MLMASRLCAIAQACFHERAQAVDKVVKISGLWLRCPKETAWGAIVVDVRQCRRQHWFERAEAIRLLAEEARNLDQQVAEGW